MYNYKNYSMQEGRDWCYQSSALCDNDVWHPNPESWLFHALLIGIKIGLFSKYRVGNEQTDICTDTLKTLCLRLPASPASLAHRRTYVHTRWKHYAYACQLHLRAWHTDGHMYRHIENTMPTPASFTWHKQVQERQNTCYLQAGMWVYIVCAAMRNFITSGKSHV